MIATRSKSDSASLPATSADDTGSNGSTAVATDGRPNPAEQVSLGPYLFKRAESADELAAVHRLNYQTFVRELPQHADPGDGQLVDKFHDRNVYYIAVFEGHVVGMISGHDQAPFSIADKMDEPAKLDTLGPRPFEVRLLAIEPEHRHRFVVTGLMWAIYRYAETSGYSHLLASGVATRIRMYERLGFERLGPATTSGEVDYIPIWCSIERMREHVSNIERRLENRAADPTADEPSTPSRESTLAMSMMPGPAELSRKVEEAFNRPQMSHRGLHFSEMFTKARQRLEAITHKPAALFVGSGTLANEVVGAALAADTSLKQGLMLSNGEFGRRLMHQATRCGLQYDKLEWEWGKRWDLEAVGQTLDKNPQINWVWAVFLESSTGMLNDIAGLIKVAKERNVRVALDCVSGLGAVPLDLSEVYLASGVANKSIGGVAGLSFVFADADDLGHIDQNQIPSYLDIVESARTPGPRFTFPSQQMFALATALESYATEGARELTYDRYAQLGQFVRDHLRKLGLPPLISEPDAAPVVTTFSPPAGLNPDAFIQRCLDWGYQIGGESRYLRERNWLQLATMGDVSLHDCQRIFDKLTTWLER